MALTLASAIRDTVANVIADAVDDGTTNPNGVLKILDGMGGTLLVTIQIDNPAFGAAAAGSATLLGVPHTGTAVAAGVAAWFDFEDRDNVIVFSGDVGASGSGEELEMSNTTIAISDTVEVSSYAVSVP